MDQILDTPQETNKTFEYAGFWIRFVSYLIDAVLLYFANVVLSYAIFGGYNFFQPALGSQLMSFVIAVLYFTLMESSAKQATLGKMAIGVQVGDEYGNQISFGNALGRYLSKIISAIILLIGFMMAGWDERKQALHDKIAGTFVFYKQ